MTCSAVLYAKDLARLSRFYGEVLAMTVTDTQDDHATLESTACQLVIVAVPPHIGASIDIASPPQRREDTPIKLVFEVESIAAVRERAAGLGGALSPALREWQYHDHRVCDGHDPEGNVFQVRERTMPSAVERWHQIAANRDAAGLQSLLADDVVFHSPVVHTPQVGKAITTQYLAAALRVFGQPSFRYLRELCSAHDAVLEFEVELDGIRVNGVDMIRWDDAGRIVEFKVMLRPLKAVNLIHQRMAALLQERAR